MENIMFKVGDVDYSNHVIDNNNGYKVQTDPVYTEWEDANGRIHRSIYRMRTSGQFTLYFETIEEYEEFCRDLASHRQNDFSYPCVVYDNNNNVEITGDFFVTYTPVRHRAEDWSDYVAAISVTVKEC